MADKVSYFVRNSDGLLQPHPEATWMRAHYKDPGEAILTWYAGERRFGCAHSVFKNYRSEPCGNKAKHDPDHNGNPTKCGHHSQAALARKAQKQAYRDAARKAQWDFEKAVRNHNFERDEIIRKIAKGHNDPRGLCQDWLDRKPEPPK